MIEYQYDTSPRKEKTVVRKKKKNQKPKLVKGNKAKAKTKINKKPNLIFAMALIFIMLFIIIYRNSMINESFNQLQGLKKQATAIQKENEQLEVNIQNSINLNNIETSAKELLGMQKLTSSQTIYLNLEKQDYVEATAEAVILEDNSDWFTKLKNKITDLF
ncbi:MAG: hypothetical protein ACI4UE_02465 [Candidatus Scatovivens sp.]